MEPLIVFSELGKRWYVVTRYTNRGGGNILAHKKYDVTEQIEKILGWHRGPEVSDEIIEQIDQSLMDGGTTKETGQS